MCAYSWSDILTFVPPSTYIVTWLQIALLYRSLMIHICSFLQRGRNTDSLNWRTQCCQVLVQLSGQSCEKIRPLRKKSGPLVIYFFEDICCLNKKLSLSMWVVKTGQISATYLSGNSTFCLARVELCGRTFSQLAILSDGVGTACTVYNLCFDCVANTGSVFSESSF